MLLDSINSSPDIYLLGECHTYTKGHLAYFRDWFNAQHREWQNQPVKASYAPEIAGCPPEANGYTYLEALGQRVPIHGEKIVLGPEESGHDFPKLKSWLERDNWNSRLVLAARRPSNIIASCHKLYGLQHRDLLQSVAKTLKLFIDVARIFPNVRLNVHEESSAKTMSLLGKFLGADLSYAWDYYDAYREKQARFDKISFEGHNINVLDGIYQDLISYVDPETLQLTENHARAPQQPDSTRRSMIQCYEDLDFLAQGYLNDPDVPFKIAEKAIVTNLAAVDEKPRTPATVDAAAASAAKKTPATPVKAPAKKGEPKAKNEPKAKKKAADDTVAPPASAKAQKVMQAADGSE